MLKVLYVRHAAGSSRYAIIPLSVSLVSAELACRSDACQVGALYPLFPLPLSVSKVGREICISVELERSSLPLPREVLVPAKHGAAFRPLRPDFILLAKLGHPLPLCDQRARVPYSSSIGD